MEKKLLMLPGYLVGCGGLALITYRTLLAVGTSSKAITVQVNQYGEQYVDLILLGVLWVVCVIGMWSFSLLWKEQKVETLVEERGGIVKDRDGVRDSFVEELVDRIPGAYAESFPVVAQGYVYVDTEWLSCGTSVSVMVVQENIQE